MAAASTMNFFKFRKHRCKLHAGFIDSMIACACAAVSLFVTTPEKLVMEAEIVEAKHGIFDNADILRYVEKKRTARLHSRRTHENINL